MNRKLFPSRSCVKSPYRERSDSSDDSATEIDDDVKCENQHNNPASYEKRTFKISLDLVKSDCAFRSSNFALIQLRFKSDQLTDDSLRLMHRLLDCDMICYQQETSLYVLIPKKSQARKNALRNISNEAHLLGIKISVQFFQGHSTRNILEPLFKHRLEVAKALVKLKLSKSYWYQIGNCFYHELWHSRSSNSAFNALELNIRFASTNVDDLESGKWELYLDIRPTVARFVFANTSRILELKCNLVLDHTDSKIYYPEIEDTGSARDDCIILEELKELCRVKVLPTLECGLVRNVKRSNFPRLRMDECLTDNGNLSKPSDKEEMVQFWKEAYLLNVPPNFHFAEIEIDGLTHTYPSCALIQDIREVRLATRERHSLIIRKFIETLDATPGIRLLTIPAIPVKPVTDVIMMQKDRQIDYKVKTSKSLIFPTSFATPVGEIKLCESTSITPARKLILSPESPLDTQESKRKEFDFFEFTSNGSGTPCKNTEINQMGPPHRLIFDSFEPQKSMSNLIHKIPMASFEKMDYSEDKENEDVSNSKLSNSIVQMNANKGDSELKIHTDIEIFNEEIARDAADRAKLAVARFIDVVNAERSILNKSLVRNDGKSELSDESSGEFNSAEGIFSVGIPLTVSQRNENFKPASKSDTFQFGEKVAVKRSDGKWKCAIVSDPRNYIGDYIELIVDIDECGDAVEKNIEYSEIKRTVLRIKPVKPKKSKPTKSEKLKSQIKELDISKMKKSEFRKVESPSSKLEKKTKAVLDSKDTEERDAKRKKLNHRVMGKKEKLKRERQNIFVDMKTETITWENNSSSLGLFLSEDMHDHVILESKAENSLASEIPDGSRLLRIGETDVSHMPFDDVIGLLVQRPISITFCTREQFVQ